MAKEVKAWYVDFPTFQYKEDVKDLARKNGLILVDAKFKGDKKQCEKAPKLTIKDEYKKA